MDKKGEIVDKKAIVSLMAYNINRDYDRRSMYMHKENDVKYVEAIKLAAGGVQYRSLSVKNTLIEAVEQLYIFYTNSVEKKYLEVAKLFIQAYLEMGFLYQEGEKVFDVILNELGEQREIEYPERNYVERKIKLNKSQVRSMIKRWPPLQIKK